MPGDHKKPTKCNSRRTHKSKSFLAVFIKDNGKSFKIQDGGSPPQLREEWVEDIDVGPRIYSFVDDLIKSDGCIAHYLVPLRGEYKIEGL